jgi:CRP-like cAMP-binding protein
MPVALKDAYLFSKLDDDQLVRVRAMAQETRLEDGQTLFHAGDEARRFFLVTDGKMKLSRLALNGNEKVIEVISSGFTFAEALMFADRPRYPVRASAIGDTLVMGFDNEAFKALLQESVDTCFRLMADMSLRLRHLIKEIDDLTLQTATGRVAGFLCGAYTYKGQTRQAFDLDMPKGVLASRLSVKPETFSRILNNFSNQGLVKVQGARIEILDVKGLRKQAESAGVCGQTVSPGGE